jgi:hypothetical protein
MQYFTLDHERSIISFNEEDDLSKKHQIFDHGIKPAFEALIENQIYFYGFWNLGDVETLRREALSHLYEMIPRFDPSRKKRAFAFFNVVSKNFFIQKSRELKKRRKIETDSHCDIDQTIVRNDPALILSSHEDDIQDKEFWDALVRAMESWPDLFQKSSERRIAEALILLMKNVDSVSIYNKKSVCFYLREISNQNQKLVSSVVKQLRDIYVEWKRGYFEE